METLIYVGKVSLYWALFYACYRLFLQQQTFFVWNRIYLIGSLLLSFALPFVIYPESAPDIQVIYSVSGPGFTISTVQIPHPALLTWTNFAWTAYILGALFMAYKFFTHVGNLIGFLKAGELIVLDDCNVVLINSNDVGSFSFLKWIVVNRNDYENHFDAILRHEMVHTSQGHSWDILLVEAMKIVFWFNPILILYKISLQEVHEYLADEAAPNRENYATFLVSYALNAPAAMLTNHFFKPSQLKSRIRMIYKNRSPRWLKSSYLLAVGFIGVVALLIAGYEKIRKNVSEQDLTFEQPGNLAKEDILKGMVIDNQTVDAPDGVAEEIDVNTPTDADARRLLAALRQSDSSVIRSHQEIIKLMPETSEIRKGITIDDSTNPIAEAAQITAPNVLQVKITPSQNQDNKIFTVVEQQPEFPGGQRAMYQFLGENIKYPDAARDANIGGRVFVSFVVSTTGEINNIMILKGLGYGCDREAVRVVSSFPKWIPAMQSGVPVNVRYNLPINFQLNSENRSGLNESKPAAYPPTLAKPSMGTGRDLAFATTMRRAIQNARTTPPMASESRTDFSELTSDRPLLIVNGKVVEDPNYFKTTDASSIESISVIKNQSAASVYGDKGKNGVISVTLKSR